MEDQGAEIPIGTERVGDEMQTFAGYLHAIFRRAHLAVEDCAEMVQETYRRALGSLANGGRVPQTKEEVKLWLAAYARRTLIDLRKKRAGRGRMRRDTVEVDIQLLTHFPDTSRSAMVVELEIEVSEYLEILRVKAGNEVANTVELVYFGESYKDAAKTLNVSTKTVTRRLRRAGDIINNLQTSRRH